MNDEVFWLAEQVSNPCIYLYKGKGQMNGQTCKSWNYTTIKERK